MAEMNRLDLEKLTQCKQTLEKQLNQTQLQIRNKS